MKPHRQFAWLLASACFMIHITAYADATVWKGSFAQAVDAARNSGRLILLLAGRETCPNCQYMKYTVCETPSVKPVLEANYICWFCPVDDSTEWYPYATGLGSFTLPLICVIDPGDATKYLERSTATQSPSDFLARLNSHLPTTAITVALKDLSATSTRLRWLTESQVRYRVLRSVDMKSWTFLGAMITGDGSPAVIEDSSTPDRCFYKVMGFK